MSIAFACVSCKVKLNAPERIAGRRIKCPKCQALNTIPAASKQTTASVETQPEADAPVPASAPPASPAAESPPTDAGHRQPVDRPRQPAASPRTGAKPEGGTEQRPAARGATPSSPRRSAPARPSAARASGRPSPSGVRLGLPAARWVAIGGGTGAVVLLTVIAVVWLKGGGDEPTPPHPGPEPAAPTAQAAAPGTPDGAAPPLVEVDPAKGAPSEPGQGPSEPGPATPPPTSVVGAKEALKDFLTAASRDPADLTEETARQFLTLSLDCWASGHSLDKFHHDYPAVRAACFDWLFFQLREYEILQCRKTAAGNFEFTLSLTYRDQTGVEKREIRKYIVGRSAEASKQQWRIF